MAHRRRRIMPCGVARAPVTRSRSYGGWRMSHGGEYERPNFEVALRGYEKRQVDLYVTRAESQISGLASERERAIAQIQNMGAQLQKLQAELTELHQRPTQIDRAFFRDLGPMVDQILALAEKQAD